MGELHRGFQQGRSWIFVELARERKLELRWNDTTPAVLPGVFDIVGAPASVIHLGMQQIDFATKHADCTHIGPLLPERGEAAPPLGDETREHSTDDLMTRSKVLCVGTREPQIRLTQFLQPHLKVVQAVTHW